MLRDSAGADALHAAALVDLRWGDSAGKSLAQSIEYLNGAARTAERPESPLADLAAAHLVRAEREGEPRELVAALDAAARAARAAPRHAAARFNLALAAERLGLDSRADSEWMHYLAIDSTSLWAAEARERRGALSRRHAPAVGAAPLAPDAARTLAVGDAGVARTHGLKDELGLWGRAVERGDTVVAARALSAARTIGVALRDAKRDESLADAVSVVMRAARRPPDQRRLARAHALYAEGHARITASDFGGGARALDSAASLAGRGSLATWASVYRGGALVYAGRASDSACVVADRVKRAADGLCLLIDAAARTDSIRYPALAGRAHWALATTLLRHNHRARGTAAARRAIDLLERAGEYENAAAVHVLLAEAEYTAGDERGAARSMMTASTMLRPHRASVWLHNVLYLLAHSADAAGLSAAAAHIRDEDAIVAIATGRPVYEVEARLERARSRAAANDRTGAAADLAAAERTITAFPSDAARRWFRAVAADVAASANLPVRLEALDTAVAFFAPSRSWTQLVSMLLARAKARIGGDLPGAERDLDSAITVLENSARELGAVRRAALLASARVVFERAALAHLARGEPAKALRALERGRTSYAHRTRAVLASPDSAVVLDLLLAGDTLVAWVLDGGDVHAVRSRSPHGAVERAAARARTSLELNSDTRGPLQELYDRLVRPVAPRLRAGRGIVIVTDGVLSEVPYAALRDGVTGRYLVQDHPLRVVGSLADATGAPRESAGDMALFIADPAFESSRFPGLPRLPGAAREVRAAATLYPRARVLQGADATAARVSAVMPGAALVHVAGHALYDAAHPERSRLVLAQDGQGAGELTADSLSHMNLRGTRLVVLSACETMRTSAVRAAAVDGFASALFAAGAQGVVGTLWRVSDAATATAMRAFHERYRTTRDATTALRAAQVAMIESGDPVLASPAAWGAFRYSGR
jgi:CHAT domain-containing protein